MRSLFRNIYGQPLRNIIMWIAIMVLAWSVVDCLVKRHRTDRAVWQMCNLAVLIVSTTGILYLTLLNRAEPENEIVLQPFFSFIEAQAQPELYRSMLMNVFLFVPFGLAATNVLSGLKRCWPAAVTVVSALALSAAIEFNQYYFHLGRCEVDDVIMNTLGAAIGASSYIIALQLQRILSKKD